MSASQHMRLYVATRDMQKALRNPQANAKQLAAHIQELHYELRSAFRALQVRQGLPAAGVSR